jgi:Glycosyltransferase family 87
MATSIPTTATLSRARRWGRGPLVAMLALIPAAYLWLVLANASYTLAWDFDAYRAAVQRWLGGGPLYHVDFGPVERFQLFQYPPTFVPIALPVALLPEPLGGWLWIGLLVAASALAIWLMPVRLEVRIATLLLGGLSWPLLFAIKVGQVGPLLLLLFVVGWRWLDRDRVVAFVTALGAALKVQPVVLGIWLLLTGRWRAALEALIAGVVLAAVATLLLGPSVWIDFVRLLGRANADAIELPTNFAVGATVLHLGFDPHLAGALQLVAMAAVSGLLVFSSLRCSRESSYLVTVVASQLLSPVLWDHYALFLLLPVAWLLQRRQWWAVLIPLSQSAILLNVTPPIGYLAGYGAVLAGLLVLGWRERDTERAQAPALRAASA